LKTLSTLLKDVEYLEFIGSKEISINQIKFDIKEVGKGDIFFATIAYGIDNHRFIEEAINKGALSIVCEKRPKKINPSITYIKVKDTLIALSLIAVNYYDNPTKKIKMIGVTGTNGKTSIVTILHQIFRKLGYKAGLLSTVTNKINDTDIPTNKTTPHATQIQSLCKRMVEEGCEYCFMEVSSHGIHQRRITGTYFTGALFSNITQDHLDYHGSFEEYFQVKKSFLDSLNKPSFVLYNLDDLNGNKITNDVDASLYSFSLKNENTDFFCKILNNDLNNLTITLEEKTIQLELRAEYNVYNILAAYAVAILLGIEKSSILDILSQIKPIEGRFNLVPSKNDIIGIIDYAHNPDGLLNLYASLTKMKRNRIITVIGCGGERDKEKRPEMAKITYQNSDFLILTSDNPRSENPQHIVNDMLKGLEKKPTNLNVILDRKKAIEYACSIAQNKDIILVAGKGHEKYQEINNIKYPFDDTLILSKALNDNFS